MFSTSTALRRVFIHPIELSRTPLRLAPQVLQHISRPLAIQQRNFAAPVRKREPPRNDQIKAFRINLVDELGEFHQDVSKADVLARMNSETHMLIIVDQPEEGRATCKIVDKKALIQQRAAKKLASKSPTNKIKMIELNWAIDGNDLGHRTNKMKEFLAKGYRVEVVFAAKRKGRKASPEECTNVLERVRGATQEVEGTKEWKPMNGKMGGQVTLYFEGKLQTLDTEEKKGETKQERKAAKREAKKEAMKTAEDVEKFTADATKEATKG